MVAFVSGRWSRGKSLVFLLTAAILASALGMFGAVPAQASIPDRPAYTWNMQGAESDGDSKWTGVVGPMLNDASQPIVVLQEVGAGPPPIAYGTVEETLEGGDLAALPPGMIGQLPAAASARQVRHTQWAFGGVNHDVYYLQTDAYNQRWEGGRTNLAIVTPRAADEVAIVPTPDGALGQGRERAALGVRLGNTWYFDVHARAAQNNNAPDLLANIDAFVALHNNDLAGGEEGLVLGDFNREPDTLPYVATQQVVATPPGTVTHTDPRGNGSRYDYGVMIDPDELFPIGVDATVNPSVYSDHDPVRINLALMPEPTFSAVPVYSSSRVIENVQAGGVITAEQSGNFGKVSSAAQSAGSSRGAWTVLSYPDGEMSFKNGYSGRCLDTANYFHLPPAAGIPIGQYNCSTRVTDRWFPDYLGNSEYQLESEEKPGLCVAVAGNQTDPTSMSDLILDRCENTPSERFFFGPSNPSNLAAGGTFDLSRLEERGPVSLQNMYNGGVMDVQGQGTADNTEVISYSRFNGQGNQGWRIVDNGNGTVSFVGVASGKCLDIHNSNTATRGRDLVIFRCVGQASQEWTPFQLADGQWDFFSEQHQVLGDCVETAGAGANPRSGNESVDACNSNGTQAFTLAPYDPTGTPSLPTDPDTD